MSQEHPNILYVGSHDKGRMLLAAVELDNWYVYLPFEMLEALAMYITYAPDVTVIDMTSDPVLAEEIYRHLRSVAASPLIVLADSHEYDAFVLPPDSSTPELIAAIQSVVQGEPELMG